jgi:molecular chaperone HtpG
MTITRSFTSRSPATRRTRSSGFIPRPRGAWSTRRCFYIPSKAPLDLYQAEYKVGVKLYVKRVFIMDDAKELLPQYLRFVRGIIDSEDLPLNVSREILQQNRVLTAFARQA